MINNKKIVRRKFMKMAGASLLLWQTPWLSAFANSGVNQQNKKIVWVLLRGALDSLHAVVPSFDSDLKSHRPKLFVSIADSLLPLEQGFALHPSLKNMHQWYQNKEMLPIVAVSSGYQERSHFDGQDFLESGKAQIDHDSGWLARAINAKNKQALAIAPSIPISLRDSKHVNTWYPSNLKESAQDTYDALAKLYQDDPLLSARLQDGLATKEMIDMKKSDKKSGRFSDLTKSCAKLMSSDQGVDCAMLELGGWDTHNRQPARLKQKLSELDQGLALLKEGLGEHWQNTVVIVATEFGRTVKENGTEGTDHGTGSALFVLGGAVKGGRVAGTWPGLSAEKLYKNRDLMPTTNSFAWIGNILQQHWQLSDTELQQVFPDVKAYKDKLIRV